MYRFAWIAGALGAVVAFRKFRRRRGAATALPESDPRAEALRRKLEESRTLVEEREEFESAETPVDAAETVVSDLDDRRRQVHEQGRAAAREMKAPRSDH